MRPTRAHFFVVAVSLALLAPLTGCSEDFTPPEKGVYRGVTDQPIDQATREALHQRSRHQEYN